MLLVADAGNSQITLGVYDNDKLLYRWALSSAKFFSSDEYGVMLINLLDKADVKDKINGVILSSVVSHLTEKFKNTIENYLNIIPIIVSHSINLGGVTINVERNEEVGADRICNVVAANVLYKTPLVVVDMGTATTFDVLNRQKEFIGGAICAGMGLCNKALASSTSLLPQIEVGHVSEVIGKNTKTNILSGTVIGHAALVDGMLDRIEEELQDKITTIVTGGYSIYVEEHLKRPFNYYNSHLTMEGLRFLYDLNIS